MPSIPTRRNIQVRNPGLFSKILKTYLRVQRDRIAETKLCCLVAANQKYAFNKSI